MRISDWSSDVCSSDLRAGSGQSFLGHEVMAVALAVGQGERRAVLVEGPGGEMVAAGLVGVHEADHGGAGHHGLGPRIAAGEAKREQVAGANKREGPLPARIFASNRAGSPPHVPSLPRLLP